ncbi:MAG: nitroreductase family protein, partial [Eubacteriales bacterium]
MTNQTLQLIASRRSHRAYKPAQISPEQLEALMTAALQSPSAMDRQPWHFSFVQDKELLKRVTRAAHEQAALLEEAQRSPRFASPAFDLFYHAPTVVFISTPNGDSAVDCGIAAQTLALA